MFISARNFSKWNFNTIFKVYKHLDQVKNEPESFAVTVIFQALPKVCTYCKYYLLNDSNYIEGWINNIPKNN